MGVHDYSCFCHGQEGDQNLVCFEGCDSDDEGDLLMPETDYFNVMTGSRDIYLFVYDIPVPKDMINTDDVLKVMMENKCVPRVIRGDYSWDTWSIKQFENYDKVLTGEETISGNFEFSLWRVNGTKWIVNVCPGCYSVIFENKKVETIPSDQLRDIASKHDIPINKTSKKELRESIREYMYGALTYRV
jgi:hypothetical protein